MRYILNLNSVSQNAQDLKKTHKFCFQKTHNCRHLCFDLFRSLQGSLPGGGKGTKLCRVKWWRISTSKVKQNR